MDLTHLDRQLQIRNPLFDPLILGFAHSEETVPGNAVLWLPAALIDRYPAQHEKLLWGIRDIPEVRTFNLRVHDTEFDLLECRLVLERSASAATVVKNIAEMIGTLYETSVKFVETTALDLVPWPEPANPTKPAPQSVPPIVAPKGWLGRLIEDFTFKWAI